MHTVCVHDAKIAKENGCYLLFKEKIAHLPWLFHLLEEFKRGDCPSGSVSKADTSVNTYARVSALTSLTPDGEK